MNKTFTIVAAVSLAFGAAAMAEDADLTIYTYDSFTSDWGPGPAIEAAFEAECGCDIALVPAGDGASLLARLRLEGERSPADVVLGLDTNLTAMAVEEGLVAPHGLTPPALDLPIDWSDAHFLPYDWGYFAFVYDAQKVAHPPASFTELASSDLDIVIQDPRTSTPGLGLLLWIKQAYGDSAFDVWGSLAPRIVTVTKGWDEAYGMFLEGEADMVLSYTTSPAYHLIAEEDDSKAAAIFAEGHYMQVEVAGVVSGSENGQLAREFLTFLLSDAAQSVIPTTNWMYPAITPAGGLPDGFAKPEGAALLMAPKEAAAVRDAALDEWLRALSR